MTTEEVFKEWRNPRRGSGNAEDMTNPFWVYCVTNPESAYTINEEFGGPSPFDEGPCWCFDRLGQTKTELPDGRVVYIAGEHEDGYDPDFFIYNDVTVVSSDGDIRIFGYSEDIFPPTDFHTATLIGKQIIIIGNLGYPDNRNEKYTPVYLLDTETFEISAQVTKGGPGWISNHEASFDVASRSIRVSRMQKWTEASDLIDNFSTWQLNIDTWKWELIEEKNWSQYRFSRKDGEGIDLYMRRHYIQMEKMGMNSDSRFAEIDPEADDLVKEGLKEMFEEQKRFIESTDKEALEKLYQPLVAFKKIIRPTLSGNDEEWERENEEIEKSHPFNHYKIEVEGITLTFIEDNFDVTLRLEGELNQIILDKILAEVTQNLEKVEKAEFSYELLK